MSEIRKYVSLMRLTQKGLTELTDSAKRRKVSEDRVAALGGRSIAFYALLGNYDFMQVFEMPSNEAMMQYVLTARRDGHVEPLILPAFDTETYGQILNAVG
ncbi:GYD domain-containing protein [Rhizobium sp. LjRoot98]|uniref:GYD domain-containing protein n=1 Tax=unclassified Rhizobium TaxID=2613769 RepID=UPI000713EAE3|nr:MULTISPECIES: GYD domain-containing protein [unclassified Rhizobium]KQV34849.1 GYD family protein [Rhizobium sp. Root1204]KQY00512.1 GYD family protein [Rhizobium sp. Root1334]KRC11697.1 GYD family protein [Rhizobium sp. Root73]